MGFKSCGHISIWSWFKWCNDVVEREALVKTEVQPGVGRYFGANETCGPTLSDEPWLVVLLSLTFPDLWLPAQRWLKVPHLNRGPSSFRRLWHPCHALCSFPAHWLALGQSMHVREEGSRRAALWGWRWNQHVWAALRNLAFPCAARIPSF